MSKAPVFLQTSPEPKLRQRLYNGRKLLIWEGKVKIDSITGWVDNPRIELAKKKMQGLVGQRELLQEEVFDLMKNDSDVKLKKLRDDLIKNGLREPLTLSFSGKLLDGNRRFFALKYALEGMPSTDPNRQDLEVVEAYVLSEESSNEDEQNVLVEENFSSSLKIEWPEYVKSRWVVEASEDGLDIEKISKKFSWSKTKVREALRINLIIKEFMIFATAEPDLDDEDGGGLGLSEEEAEVEVSQNYQFFNEAQKSFFKALETDLDFKIQFFKWIHEKKFSSFQEVRIAHQAWSDPEARAAIMGQQPTAAKSAKAVIDYNKRVIKTKDETVGRIDSFAEFLKGLTAEQMKSLPESSLELLKESLKTVTSMTEAALREHL